MLRHHILRELQGIEDYIVFRFGEYAPLEDDNGGVLAIAMLIVEEDDDASQSNLKEGFG